MQMQALVARGGRTSWFAQMVVRGGRRGQVRKMVAQGADSWWSRLVNARVRCCHGEDGEAWWLQRDGAAEVWQFLLQRRGGRGGCALHE